LSDYQPSTAQVSLRMPREDRDDLVYVARVNGTSVMEEIRKAVDKHLDVLRSDEEFLARAAGTFDRQRASFLGRKQQ